MFIEGHLENTYEVTSNHFLSNVVGICRQDGSLISELTRAEAKRLIAEGIISGGMIPKVTACLDALSAVSRVHIVDGGEPTK